MDDYIMIEAERMSYKCKKQKDLRSETYSKLVKLADDPDFGVQLRSKKVLLPSSFTGSPKYMMQNYLDAMTICKFYGYYDLFITFTCNTNWPEILRFTSERVLKSKDQPDIVARVFKMKLDSLMEDLKDVRMFGRVKGGPEEWSDLSKYDDVVYPTYRDACYARGLLQNDKEYINGLVEASR
nr:putative PIF1 DNA helicase/replication protein A1-like protein [Tanacetum cinerariifolium]